MHEETREDGSGKADQVSRPDMSVILITPDSYETIRRVVKALRQQTVRERLEIVIVGPSCDQSEFPASDFADFAGYQVLEINDMTSTSFARAEGINAARGLVVAMTEDHCFPAPDWAEALIDRHKEPWTGVGSVFCNANPRTAVSWANFLVEYGEWADPIPPGPTNHIPGHNSSYKRDALLEYGPDLGDVLEAESPMQWDMMNRGHSFCMEPKAKMFHQNFSVFGQSIPLRFYGGRLFAANRAHEWSFLRRLSYCLLSPLIPLVRVCRVLQAANRIGQSKLALRVLPTSFIMLVFDGLGEMVGYVAGSGSAMQRLSDMEFHRERFLVDGDRVQLSPDL
ncbi:MAG: glycosyltransferase [Deltaproteobacteria bacterium]|nr:glycosyltransferase [Deltaproteobacteria bacterium]